MSATINQPYIFLATLYGGLIVGLLYGVIAAVRHFSHAGRWATVVWDILFFILGTLVCLAAIYIANKANLRLYTFLGLSGGFCMYFFGIHQTAIRLYKKHREKKTARSGGTPLL